MCCVLSRYFRCRSLHDIEGLQGEQQVKKEKSEAELRGAVDALDKLMAVSEP